jgi:acyl-CoA thioesterase-1
VDWTALVKNVLSLLNRLVIRCGICMVLACMLFIEPAQAQNTAGNTAATRAPVILIVGDSISAEYGLPRDTGWIKLLDARLHEQGFDYSVVNASISGDTTSGGLSRLPALLQQLKPNIVIVELGGNDGLRGLSLAATETNLSKMIEAAQALRAKVMLIGMQLPPNYGKTYGEQFAGLYPKLARQYKTALLPFFFEGFGDRLDAFQPDRIHPKQESQGLLLENVWPRLQPLLSKRGKNSERPGQ